MFHRETFPKFPIEHIVMMRNATTKEMNKATKTTLFLGIYIQLVENELFTEYIIL